MEPNKSRIIQAIGHVVSEAQKKNVRATQYIIVKSLFIADRMHLNRFGRPITFDNYVAMDHGPVPSFSYSILKGEGKVGGIDTKNLPWRKKAAPDISKNAYVYLIPDNSDLELDELSSSDLEALTEALIIVSSLSFLQLKKLTHEDPAYEAAWEGGDRRSYPMSYGLLFDVPDFARAEDLAFASRHP